MSTKSIGLAGSYAHWQAVHHCGAGHCELHFANSPGPLQGGRNGHRLPVGGDWTHVASGFSHTRDGQLVEIAVRDVPQVSRHELAAKLQMR